MRKQDNKHQLSLFDTLGENIEIEQVDLSIASAIALPPVVTRKVPTPTKATLRLDADLNLHPWVKDGWTHPSTTYEVKTRNLEALEPYKRCLKYGRPTPKEKITLARYLGMGATAEIFQDTGRDQIMLRNMVGDEDYASMQAATPFAFYTPPFLIRGIWKILTGAGFTGGRVLEPAAGIGSFIGGAPDAVFINSHFTAIEQETVAGNICQMLYTDDGNVDVKIGNFEDTHLKSSSFDLIISNVPFGQVPVHDPAIEKAVGRFATRAIHNYYFVRSMALVRPGGLIAFLTSRFTLDSEDASVRNFLADQADLVAIRRLSNKTFFGTEVVADLIVLRKRLPDEAPGDRSWVETVEVHSAEMARDIEYKRRRDGKIGKPLELGRGEVTHSVNRWLWERPNQITGELCEVSGPYGPTITCYASIAAPIILPRLLQWRGDPIYQPVETSEEEIVSNPAPADTKPGEYYIRDGKLYRNNWYEEVAQQKNAKDIDRIAKLIEISQTAQQVLSACAAGHDLLWKEFRIRLFNQYQSFVTEYGPINDKSNVRPFEADPRSAPVRALEVPVGKGWEPADIFSRRTVGTITYPTRADSAADALALSLARYGRVNLLYMQTLTGREQLESELAGVIYFDSIKKEWVTADEYLSGNVVEKLQQAREAGLPENIAALEIVQPTPLGSDEIHVSLSAAWVPEKYVTQFLHELLDEDSTANHMDDPSWKYSFYPINGVGSVVYLPPTGQWIINGISASSTRRNVLATERWGTIRRNAIELLGDALNQLETIISDPTVDGGTVVNKPETIAARAQKHLIKTTFSQWVWRDAKRASDLIKLYNEKFNTFVVPKFNGQHLSFPGLNPLITPRPYQKNTVWRVLRTGSAFLWHIVGSGKTLEMILTVMESRRLGLRKKPMIVVPNHLLDQFAGEWYRAYPMANLLIVRTDDLSPNEVQSSLARIATGDYDCILLTQSSFSRIQVGDTVWASFMNAELERIADYIDELSIDKHGNHTAIKVLERKKRGLIVKMQNRVAKAKERADRGGLTWESLGVDMLLVDEAQNYKNLEFTTNLQVAGVGDGGSSQAYDLFVKSQWTTRRCKAGHLLGDATKCDCGEPTVDGALVLATGTALDNSISELYTWQRFLQMSRLSEMGLIHFDSWAAQFGATETVIEMKPSGKGWRQKDRFVRFNNVPDLIKLFSLVCDTLIDPNEMGLERPALVQGEPIAIECQPTEAMIEYLDECARRAENLDQVDPEVDNILKIMSDAMKAAIDMRLIRADAEDDPRSKVNQLVQRLYQSWKDSQLAGEIHTQAVFLDIGTPNGSTFNLYGDIKAKLVALGIPDEQIAFAQTAKTDREKKAMFAAVDRGDIRIIIGSTRRMGTGVNMQTHLKSLHHIDAPWTPGAIEQRDGRILRAGNSHGKVAIYRYITARSMDFYKWHLITLKANFIKQIATGGLTKRTVEDLENTVISFSQMKAMATGDDRIIEKVRLEAELTKLETIYDLWERSRRSMQMELLHLPEQIEAARLRYERHIEASEFLESNPDRSLIINGRPIAESNENKVMESMTERASKTHEEFEFQIGPATVRMEYREILGTKAITAHIKVKNVQTNCNVLEQGAANLRRMRNAIEELTGHYSIKNSEVTKLEDRLAQCTTEIKRDFAREDELIQMRRQLMELEEALYGDVAGLTEATDDDEDDEKENEI